MSDSPESPVEWVRTDKFVMPVVPVELQVDPRTLAILHCIAFLELSGDETVDPDWAVEAMEHVAHYLLRLAPNEVDKLRSEMQQVASWAESEQMAPQFVNLARRFTEYAGLDPD
jgi:hypothetical protein